MSERVACINCGRNEDEVPLVSLRYRGRPFWACTQCMPIVIHHTEQIAEKLSALLDQERGSAHA